jgi:hypothetical protein
MEENKNFWTRQQNELTVGDSMKMAAILVIGSTVASVVVIEGAEKVASLIERKREIRKNKIKHQEK